MFITLKRMSILLFLIFVYQCSGNKSSDTASSKKDSVVKTSVKPVEINDVNPLDPIKLREIHKNIYMARGTRALPSPKNRGFMSNSYGILTSQGWFIVDALSTPALSKEFIGELNKIIKAPIKYVVITHYHQDHWYGAQSYKDHGTKIIAHKNITKYVESDYSIDMLNLQKKMFKIYDNVKLTPPSMPITKKTIIRMGDKEFHVEPFTPAHTNTDLIVYTPDDKMMYVGDLVSTDTIPNASDKFSNSSGWIKVLEKMKTYQVNKLLSGHNMPMDVSGVDFNIKYLTYIRKQVKELKAQNKTYDEIKSKLRDNPFQNKSDRRGMHNANIYKLFNDLDNEFLSN